VNEIPHSVAAERAVLGALMLDPDCAAYVVDEIEAGDFYREAHGATYRAILAQWSAGEPTEMVAIVERLEREGDVDRAGGVAYVAALADDVPSTLNVGHYAKIVRRHAVARRAVDAGRTLQAEARSGEHEPDELVARGLALITALDDGRGGSDTTPQEEIEDAVNHAIAVGRGDAPPGMSTGYAALDEILGGFYPSDMVVLGGRPGMGKTAAALSIARRMAGNGVGVAMFQLEMGKRQCWTRFLVGETLLIGRPVENWRLKKPGLLRSNPGRGIDDEDALRAAASSLWDLPIRIDDRPGVTINQIRARSRRIKAQSPELGLIIVDHIGLTSGEPGQRDKRAIVEETSRGCKILAKELGVTVLALSQLNRSVESRNPKTPQLSDLRESGSIEQDADVVMFAYRDEYYNPDSSPVPGQVDLIIAKQRNGSTGTVSLGFQGDFTAVTDLPEAAPEGYRGF
jgi:replicative DNA helicase